MSPIARLIAFYLPQFHPIPENDAWWGKGFTEWTNTAKARRRFLGHYQPHIPADLGFYDLRVPEVRAAQADLARRNGIEAFCYYHYWFAGKQILERPFSEVLRSGEPDFPFCICWANHSWAGVWENAPDRMLIEQTYPGEDDHRAHFEALLPAFTDRRYIRVNDAPLLVIYIPTGPPDPRRTTDLWREMAVRAGLPGLHLAGCTMNPSWNPLEYGFDASVVQRFPPRRSLLANWRHPARKIHDYVSVKLGRPTIYRYKAVLDDLLPSTLVTDTNYPTVLPNWDNSPRSGPHGLVLHGSTPELFRKHLRRALALTEGFSPDRRLIFVKSWNEWAEGNHLEPDLRFGHAYLSVIRDEILRRAPSESSERADQPIWSTGR